MSYELEYEYAIGTPVHVDGCKGLIGYITAVSWRHIAVVNYEVSWVTNGKSEACLIEGWRLEQARV